MSAGDDDYVSQQAEAAAQQRARDRDEAARHTREEAVITAAQRELHEHMNARWPTLRDSDPYHQAAVQAAADTMQRAAARPPYQEERSTTRVPVTVQTVISGLPVIASEYATYDDFQQHVQTMLQTMSAAQARPAAPWLRAAGGRLMFVRGKIRSHIGQLAATLSQASDMLPVPPVETDEDTQARTGRGIRQVMVPAPATPDSTMRVVVAPLVIPVSLMGDIAADVLSAIVYVLCDVLVAGGRQGVSDKQKAVAKAATRHIMDMLNRHRYLSTHGNPASLQNIRQCAYSIRMLREQLGLRDCHIVIPLTCCGYGEAAGEAAVTAAWHTVANWPPLRIFLDDCPNTLVVLGVRDDD